ncbi:MAG: AraC family transcriptional regulator [Ancrocorticia sp.]
MRRLQTNPNEFYFEHVAPKRGIRSWQYVYEIGSYHYNWHAAPELLLILSGEVEVCAAGRVSVLGPGDMVLINSREGHATLATQPRSVALLLHIDSVYLASFHSDGKLPHFDCRSTPLTFDAAAFVMLRRLLSRMMLATPIGGLAGTIARYESDLAHVVAILLEQFTVPDEQGVRMEDSQRDEVLRSIMAYIDQNFQRRITLRQLGEVAGYNPGYVSQLFTQVLGMTTSEYIRRVRLAQAVRDLGYTSKRIVDIALDNGFSEVKAFNAAFQSAFCKTPSQYRHYLREIGEDIREVDEVFHQRFVGRDDEEIRARLREFAGTDENAAIGDSGAQSTTTRSSEVAGILDDSVSLAKLLIANLEQLTG